MNIEKIITSKTIFLEQNFKTAEEIINFIGDVFEKNGYCNNNYKTAMLEIFKNFPGVIVLDDGVAMPHARPEEGALKNGLVIIKLKKPVDFYNESFEKVDTVIGLCSTGSDEHIELIQLVGCLIENNIRNIKFYENNDVLKFVYKIKDIEGL